ncbi:NUDIX hydrolase [Bauldia litoralis]|uniref:NUDIX domain-containing protein n=1 Tax=Bauldia litoralis TaxID=665467 RepID=A0A1G6C966_9HYPH|nr:NUDIX domain-containing protein [Bauldia litoralis]SDB29445.1 NUDIX domain-containing protein [Bauldia litoralis]
MSSPSPRPRLGVSVVIRRDEMVLLVQRGKPPYLGLWAFPGGGVEYGEALAVAAAREVREETGLTVDIGAVIDHAEILPGHESAGVGGHYVLVVFAARPTGGDLAAGDDAADARWFSAADLRSLEMTRDTNRILADLGMR